MIEDPMDKGRIKLTLKINQLDPPALSQPSSALVIALLRTIKPIAWKAATKERIDMLMRYLNI